MSQKLIVAKIQLKQAELEELENELAQEIQKEFTFISLDEMLNLLKQNPNKKYSILSYNSYKEMNLFYREGRYIPRYLSPASVNTEGTPYIGYFPVVNGKPTDDRFRSSFKDGLYIKL